MEDVIRANVNNKTRLESEPKTPQELANISQDIIEQLAVSLQQHEAECQRYLELFLLDYREELTQIRAGSELLCEFEQMDGVDFRPTLRSINANAEVGMDEPNITDSGDDFFHDRAFLPNDFYGLRKIVWYWGDDEILQLLDQTVDEAVKAWLLSNWHKAVEKTGIDTPLYWCSHHENDITTNLATGEVRQLIYWDGDNFIG
uniref:hypothetical protein n=1 Tax=Thaumasiovibrio occultus TaxID=1891184 RepID=UPI000B3642E6|nr:hypothetical protein [Thaumasiovibrio occultus]